jgi:RNA polymerase sigma factor (sigma-70 family)
MPLADPDMPTGDNDEARDVAEAAAGDAGAFERLYRRHLPRVASLARWLVGPDDVEDAVQEVFVRVWQKLGSYAGQSAFGTWLYRVAVNLMLRRREVAGRHRARYADLEGAPEPAGLRRDPELAMAIEGAVDRLPARARDVFVLHDVQGFRHEEIAAALGIDAGTSRSQLHRARMLLRGHLS